MTATLSAEIQALTLLLTLNLDEQMRDDAERKLAHLLHVKAEKKRIEEEARARIAATKVICIGCRSGLCARCPVEAHIQRIVTDSQRLIAATC